jgi:hypothetical protein
MKLRFIVTGVNRSGTVFTARLLTSLGIPCGHESIFDNLGETEAKKRLLDPRLRRLSFSSTHETFNHHKRIPNWVDATKTVAESSYLVVPYLSWPELQDASLIHVVRNPFKVVSSVMGDIGFFQRKNHQGTGWEQPIHKMLPELNTFETQIERCCYYYLKWNEAIEKEKEVRPYLFTRVEDLPSQKLFDFTHTCETSSEFRDKRINHFGRRKKEIVVEDIPDGELKSQFLEKVKEYGYEVATKKIGFI